ncbi:hypothetical protein RRG08_052187 [Elysia crispata]|uniref:Ig-like domain-containing protein n=1 Tax=Elysia crispata TaxID=231223 RepID=A0AAE0YZU6_9GAST|nr:hypothetical protein RRG08_052187 [Elysia crispata]
MDGKMEVNGCMCIATLHVSPGLQLGGSSILVEQYTQYHVTLNDEWVMRGGTTALRCVIDPTYVTDYVKVIGWKRAGHELHSSGRVSILRDGVLHIRGVQAEDTGRLSPYTCITRNILTGENRTSDGASITLHDDDGDVRDGEDGGGDDEDDDDNDDDDDDDDDHGEDDHGSDGDEDDAHEC